MSQEGYVPYGWQFRGERVSVPSARRGRINCFGIVSRDCRFMYRTTQATIDSDFIIEQLDMLSLKIARHTVVVLDNAAVHRSARMAAMRDIWAGRKLFIFFLPPYSPHLNIIERLWKELKARWIQAADYASMQQLSYSLELVLMAIGKDLKINFQPASILSH